MSSASINDLPVEIHAKILGYIADSFTLHRVERVCLLWNGIVTDFERRGLKFRRKKIIRRLKRADSLSESLSIPDTAAGCGRRFKQGSVVQERAEKVFLSHMEIIRLKYPVSLERLRRENSSASSEFGVVVAVSRPIILIGVGVFLPHGENLKGELEITVWIQEHAAQIYGPRGRILEQKTFRLSVRQQLDHARMCIDHELGTTIRKGVECMSPPRAIDSQRKFKRRCFGIHPWPVSFDQSMEVTPDRPYHLGLRMRYVEDDVDVDGGGEVETVWGGGGDEIVEVAGADLRLRFTRCQRSDVRSSATAGQFPFLFYI